MKGWAEGERREGQGCREVYLSMEVVVEQKDASEAQEEDRMDLGQRKVCPWGMERSCVCVCVCVCVGLDETKRKKSMRA